jgi:hypothetical protein
MLVFKLLGVVYLEYVFLFLLAFTKDVVRDRIDQAASAQDFGKELLGDALLLRMTTTYLV